MTACFNLSFFRLAEISWRRCLPLFIDILDYGAALTPLCNSGNRRPRYGCRCRAVRSIQVDLDYFIRLPANRLAESNDGKPAIDPTLCSLYRSRTDSHPNDLAQPQLNVQYRIRRDQIGESFVSISEMRTQAHLTVAAWFHADQRIFDSSDCSSFP